MKSGISTPNDTPGQIRAQRLGAVTKLQITFIRSHSLTRYFRPIYFDIASVIHTDSILTNVIYHIVSNHILTHTYLSSQMSKRRQTILI